MYILTTFRGTDVGFVVCGGVSGRSYLGGGCCGDSWLRGTAVERRSLTGELSLS